MAKIIAVHGSTGTQGGSVVQSLIKSDWKVRALTRNTYGDAAKALNAAGVEVVAANFDDEASLTKAYEVQYTYAHPANISIRAYPNRFINRASKPFSSSPTSGNTSIRARMPFSQERQRQLRL